MAKISKSELKFLGRRQRAVHREWYLHEAAHGEGTYQPDYSYLAILWTQFLARYPECSAFRGQEALTFHQGLTSATGLYVASRFNIVNRTFSLSFEVIDSHDKEVDVDYLYCGHLRRFWGGDIIATDEPYEIRAFTVKSVEESGLMPGIPHYEGEVRLTTPFEHDCLYRDLRSMARGGKPGAREHWQNSLQAEGALAILNVVGGFGEEEERFFLERDLML